MGEAKRRRELGLPPKGKPSPQPKARRGWIARKIHDVPGIGRVERDVDGAFYGISRNGERVRLRGHAVIAKCEAAIRKQARRRSELEAAARRYAKDHAREAEAGQPAEPNPPACSRCGAPMIRTAGDDNFYVCGDATCGVELPEASS